jgi:hypothetical protein
MIIEPMGGAYEATVRGKLLLIEVGEQVQPLTSGDGDLGVECGELFFEVDRSDPGEGSHGFHVVVVGNHFSKCCMYVQY